MVSNLEPCNYKLLYSISTKTINILNEQIKVLHFCILNLKNELNILKHKNFKNIINFNNRIEEAKKDRTCCVCYFENLPCNHYVCRGCYDDMIKHHHLKCPLCRKEFIK